MTTEMGGVEEPAKPAPSELDGVTQALLAQLSEENFEALLAAGFEGALVGIGRRPGQPALAIYSRGKCLEILMDGDDDMTLDEAAEYFDINVSGAWLGEHTPIFVDFESPE